MIEFISENEFVLEQPERVSEWIKTAVKEEDKILQELAFVFCSDEELHKMNVEYLEHDTLTDVITFDYCFGNTLAGEIYISTDRITDNANSYDISFTEELHRVIIHGVLHLCGYKDKTENEVDVMRLKEEIYLKKAPKERFNL